jgi:hypothetical protein
MFNDSVVSLVALWFDKLDPQLWKVKSLPFINIVPRMILAHDIISGGFTIN